MKHGALFSILRECTIRRTRNSIKWRIKGDTKNCIDGVTANFFDVVIFLVLCFFSRTKFHSKIVFTSGVIPNLLYGRYE